MNKDKVIKDLKERNNQLANQYRLRDIRCVHLEKENERLKKDYSIIVNENCNNLLLEKKVEQLEKNRDKAIEFGNGLLLGEATFEERHIASRFLNILKGESDE